MKHGSGSMMLLRDLWKSAGARKLFRAEGKIDGCEYISFLKREVAAMRHEGGD